jgi:hypothetical protein
MLGNALQFRDRTHESSSPAGGRQHDAGVRHLITGPDGTAERARDYVRGGEEVAVQSRFTSISFALAAAAVFLRVWPVCSGLDGRRATHAMLLQT